jgi:hypothetical protein
LSPSQGKRCGFVGCFVALAHQITPLCRLLCRFLSTYDAILSVALSAAFLVAWSPSLKSQLLLLFTLSVTLSLIGCSVGCSGAFSQEIWCLTQERNFGPTITTFNITQVNTQYNASITSRRLLVACLAQQCATRTLEILGSAIATFNWTQVGSTCSM